MSKKLVRVLLLSLAFCVLLAGAAQAAPPVKPPTVEQRLAALEAKVAAQQTQIAAQQTQIAAQQNQIDAQANQIAFLDTSLNSLQANPALALAPYVSVNPSAMNGVKGPNIVFNGANLHILSGSGSTDDGSYVRGSDTYDPSRLTGLGNLIVGYNDLPLEHAVARSGSHNLVVGTGNNFSGFAGFVAADQNSISKGWSSISGGYANTASGQWASISGGEDCTASGGAASVSGGRNNIAGGQAASVTGGLDNAASTMFAAVSGGWSNSVSADSGSISGGGGNSVSAEYGSVSGGFGNSVTAGFGSVSGGERNVADGYGATVGGGLQLHLDTELSWAAGFPLWQGQPNDPFTQAWFLTQGRDLE